MNKFLLIIFTLLLLQNAKAQVLSIDPNSADYGQTLNTTITMASGVMNMGSPPMQNGDIYLQQGNKYIYASNFTLSSPQPPFDDTINVNFLIPPVVPSGLYDVHVLTSTYIPFPPYIQFNDNVLVNGFTIHPEAGTISGKVFFDLNQNGIEDGSDRGTSNINVLINPGNYVYLTDTSGNYSFNVDTGTYTISLSLLPGYTQTTPTTSYIITVPPDSAGNDFGVYTQLPSPLEQNFYVVKQRMRCISKGYSGWKIHNPMPVTETGSITFNYSSNLTLDSTSITPTSTTGNTIRWDYVLQPFTSIECFISFMNPAALDTVWFDVTDSIFDDNGVFQKVLFSDYETIVRCSFDPNDKHATPAGEDSLHLTLRDTELTYLINFQNTGNDTAFNVHILDTITANLDLSTIKLLGSTDPVNLVIHQNGALRFEFDNIMLPDSNIDEPGSHGHVVYSIKPLTGLPDSTVIENTAYIYFDFNAPIVTNTTFNTMVYMLPVSVRAMETEKLNLIYPNPVTRTSLLQVPQGNYRLCIFDVSGREIVNSDVAGNYMIDNSEYAEGVYYYRLTNSGKTISGKFIVVK